MTNWRRSSRKTIASCVSDMRVVLHILTRPDDAVAQEIISRQREESGQEVNVVDLTAAVPDYTRLLEEIFAADAVAVW